MPFLLNERALVRGFGVFRGLTLFAKPQPKKLFRRSITRIKSKNRAVGPDHVYVIAFPGRLPWARQWLGLWPDERRH